MTKGEIWKIFSDAFIEAFKARGIYEQDAALSDGNLAGALACYEAGCRVTDDQLEKRLVQVLEERDAADEAVSDIYYKIIGKSPEWSNLFGFPQVIEEIEDAFNAVRAAAKERLSHTEPSGATIKFSQTSMALQCMKEGCQALAPSSTAPSSGEINILRSHIKGATTNLWSDGKEREDWHRRVDALCDLALSATATTKETK